MRAIDRSDVVLMVYAEGIREVRQAYLPYRNSEDDHRS